jgi:hypothetical protein
MDWGMSSPGCALGVAVPRENGLRGPGGRVFPARSRLVLCEVHSASSEDPSVGLQWGIDAWADELKATGERFGIARVGCADDARGLGADESVISELARHDLHFTRPDKGSRAGGWALLKSAMLASKHADPDAPWTMIHPTRCPYTVTTVPMLSRDQRRLDDADTRGNDHSSDAWRYAMSFEPPVSRSYYGGMIY